MEKKRGKPASRLPITPENVRLSDKPPAPGRTLSSQPMASVHRSTASTRNALPPVSLTAGRNQPLARQNLYVETPHNKHSSQSHALIRQPTPLKPNSSSTCDATSGDDGCEDSIICKQCRRCKCRQCAAPRALPKGWCGDNEVSAQCIVDYCTCMKLVRCCFDVMNITDREHDGPVSDRACACCSQPQCCKRWTCMGLMSLCLPCLCCYPPLKCCLMACTACYNGVTHKGCRCDQRRSNEPGSKRLIEHENSSST